jgi:hypothetical protein
VGEGGGPQPRELLRQPVYLVRGVEATGVGEDPQAGRAQRFLLRADGGARAGERDAVGGHAGHRDETGTVCFGECAEAGAAVAELGAGELGGLRGGAGRDVGDAEAVAGQLGLLGRPQQAVGEAGQVQCGPEPVARPGEVPAGRRRVQARVDPAEQDVQRLTSRGQHVRERAVPRRV